MKVLLIDWKYWIWLPYLLQSLVRNKIYKGMAIMTIGGEWERIIIVVVVIVVIIIFIIIIIIIIIYP
jgi:hypothetical protein